MRNLTRATVSDHVFFFGRKSCVWLTLGTDITIVLPFVRVIMNEFMMVGEILTSLVTMLELTMCRLRPL